MEKKIKVKGLTVIGGWYYYRPAQIDGIRPPRVRLGTRRFDEAVRLALQMKRTRAPEFSAGTLAFEQARFLKHRWTMVGAKALSVWSYDAELSLTKVFARAVGKETLVTMITRKVVDAWLDGLREKGRTDGTLETYSTRLKVFFDWLVEDGVLAACPVVVREVSVRKTRADRFCTKEERERLLAVARAEHGQDVELMDMLMLGFHAGLRLKEMVEARVDWLRFWEGGGEVRVLGTDSFTPKNGKERRIPMNRVLYEYLRGRTFKGPFLFRPEIGKAKHKYRFRKEYPLDCLGVKAGMEWVGWHTLRHTFATLLVQGGCPIATVAQWLGDGIEVTFKHYVGYAPVEQHVNAGL